jgi:hypothetical protein
LYVKQKGLALKPNPFLIPTNMKNTLFILLVVTAMIACNTDPRNKLKPTGTYGVAFDTTNPLSVGDVDAIINSDYKIALKAKGTVAEYCKGEGCWLTLKNEVGGGSPILVEVKDKAFVLPHNIEGKTVIVNGLAATDTLEDGTFSIKIVADGITFQ